MALNFLELPTAEVFAPLLANARYKGAFGGRGSGKSHFFAEQVIELAIVKKGLRVVCIREIQKSLEQSVKRLIEDKIIELGVGHLFDVKHDHINTPGGGIIIFQGMQNHTAQSIKSLEGYHIAWVEEAQTLTMTSLNLLRPTIRAPGSQIWFSWNPKSHKDPVERLLRGPDRVPNAILVEANWSDNPWFPNELYQEMMWDRVRDPEKYAHVWMGKYQKISAAQVFKNWKEEFFDTPDNVTFLFGADWGFAQDPTTLIRCFENPEHPRKLFVDRELYRIGLEIDHTPLFFSKMPGVQGAVITADSARPETISYMKRNGFPNMRRSLKGKDSVKEGIEFLKTFDIVVHPRCRHTIDELTFYSYKVDKEDENIILPELEDDHNHIIDPLRYALESKRRARSIAATAPMRS